MASARTVAALAPAIRKATTKIERLEDQEIFQNPITERRLLLHSAPLNCSPTTHNHDHLVSTTSSSPEAFSFI
jgi:hypothetical protein